MTVFSWNNSIINNTPALNANKDFILRKKQTPKNMNVFRRVTQIQISSRRLSWGTKLS